MRPNPDTAKNRQWPMGVNFRSDNETLVAPEIMAALAEVNVGTAHVYGGDPVTTRAKRRIREVLETRA